VLGLGSGVEISPEVVKGSESLRGENGDVLRKPGVNLIVGDGRSHLALATGRYT